VLKNFRLKEISMKIKRVPRMRYFRKILINKRIQKDFIPKIKICSQSQRKVHYPNKIAKDYRKRICLSINRRFVKKIGCM
jgi:hypothetical protein